jgi:hypothetical protein
MKKYSFKYNKGDSYDGNFTFVNNLKYTVFASSEEEAFNEFYKANNIDRFDSNTIIEFTNIESFKTNPCGQLPHEECFDCQNHRGPGPIT